jgi:tetratricopeptide (TPR) repeat protein
MRWITGMLLAALLAVGPACTYPTGGKQTTEKPRSFTVTKKAYLHLSEARELLAEKKYPEALAELERMKRRKYLNDHERALMWQLLAGVHAARDEFEESAACLEESLKLDALPEGAMQDTRFNLGELYLVLGEFEKSSALLTDWIAQVDRPLPKSYYIVATAHAQAGHYAEALPYAKKAVEGMKSPPGAWLQLLLSLRFELEQHQQLLALLKRMIESFPDEKRYWLQLASVYEQTGKSDESLAVLELAYARELLSEPSELLNLARLYMSQGIALKAVQLMDKEMAAGRLAREPESLQLLANACLMIRDQERAQAILQAAAEQSQNGEIHLQLARLQAERQQWAQARASIEKALSKAGLGSPGSAHLLLGIVNYNSNRDRAALAAFDEAARYEPTRQSAQKWIELLRKRNAACASTEGETCPDQEAQGVDRAKGPGNAEKDLTGADAKTSG